MKLKGNKITSWYTVIVMPVSICMLVVAMFYNSWYMDVANYIAMDLNRGASLEDYEKFITGFILGGNIQPLSTGMSNFLIVASILLMYSAVYVHINGKSTESLKNLVKMDYWSKFFVFKYEEYRMSEGTRKAIAEIKRNEMKLKSQKLESMAKKELTEQDLEKRRILEELKSRKKSNEKPA